MYKSPIVARINGLLAEKGIQHNLARIPPPLRWWEELRLANSPPLWYNQC